MPHEKHPLDVAAERLEALSDAPVAANDVSHDYWELRSAADESVVGDYPQTEPCEEDLYLQWGDSEGLGPDGFPVVPFPDQRLRSTARWTDVLKSSLPAAWSEGHLFNEKAAEVFRQCNLGTFREYPARVYDHEQTVHTLTYFHMRNRVDPSDIDYGRSEFYVTDILGLPLGPVSVESFEDWQRKLQQAQSGELDGCEEFSSLSYKRLYFLPGKQPAAECFKLGRLGTAIYISTHLKELIVQSGITGLEIKENRRLFAG